MLHTQTAVRSAVLNKDVVLDRVGGDESLLREITEIFLTEYPGLIDEIRAAVQNRDAWRLQVSAHTLKGSVSNFGAEAATWAALQLERMGRQQELEGAPEALRMLEVQFSMLEPALRAIVTE